jgi:hypothetical protein
MMMIRHELAVGMVVRMNQQVASFLASDAFPELVLLSHGAGILACFQKSPTADKRNFRTEHRRRPSDAAPDVVQPNAEAVRHHGGASN